MTRADECKAKIEALRLALRAAEQNRSDWDGRVHFDEFSSDVEREIRTLQAQARAAAVPA